ncbi:MAG TPA: peptidoglycan editing factor PgeF [Anaeromyxobacteraceae bacterium]|nr:peptidoglycan editing factor PgeF [Anaeromyxobacteraceae bacterium]
MELVSSRLLARFPHGFSTRRGGVSPAPWDSLNLGGAVGDDPGRVAENWRRLEAATGLAFARVQQVHGARVVTADAPSAPCDEADAVVSRTPGVAACISVADCVPVLIADPTSGAVAAVHAGWRGTVARAAAAAVEALTARGGARPRELLAAIGPSIGPCCYEVSPDLAARFEEAFGAGVVDRSRSAPRLDLWEANVRALGAAGLLPERIDALRRCTACEDRLFFSHRRDAGATGRQAAWIAPGARDIAGRAVP